MTLLYELKKFPQAYFAYLLRADLRKGLPIGELAGVEAFLHWWDIDGEREYGKSRQGQSLIHQFNWQRVPVVQDGGTRLIPRLWRDIWLSRDDLQASFPLLDPDFEGAFEQWYYSHGVEEIRSLSPVSAEMEARYLEPFWLDQEFSQLAAAASTAPEVPYLTKMALSVWRSRTDLQTIYDLKNGEGRMGFLAWSLTRGTEEHRCLALVVKSWKAKLFDNLPKETAGKTPMILQLICFVDRGLVDRLKLKAGHRARGLKEWFMVQGPKSFPVLSELYREQLKIQSDKTSETDLSNLYPPGVNLIGYAKGEIGIGEDVRMLALALEKQGVPVHVVDVPLPSKIRQQDTSVAHLITKMPKYATNIFCMTGFETARFYIERGSSFFANRYNIGYWPWELSQWPEIWAPVFDIVDEVWASSTFIQKSYRRTTDKPVRLLPLAVTAEGASSLSRSTLELPTTPYLFLFIFDFNSFMTRKNPLGVLEAFQRAFPMSAMSPEKDAKTEDTGLVFKVINTDKDDSNWQQFSQLCASDPRVKIIDETLDKADVLGLINACDALVSLHRSEGFGRTLAEAFLLEKDVIATNYSGNVDFMSQENSYPVDYSLEALAEGDYFFGTGQVWATADLDHAASRMQEAFRNRTLPARSSRALEKDGNPFSLERVGAMAVELLCRVPDRDFGNKRDT